MDFGTCRWTAGQKSQWICYWPCEMAVEVNLCKHVCFSFLICLTIPTLPNGTGCELCIFETVHLLASVPVPWLSLKVLSGLQLQLHSKCSVLQCWKPGHSKGSYKNVNPVLYWMGGEEEFCFLKWCLIDNCTANTPDMLLSHSQIQNFIFFSPSPCRDLKQLTMTLQPHLMTPS